MVMVFSTTFSCIGGGNRGPGEKFFLLNDRCVFTSTYYKMYKKLVVTNSFTIVTQSAFI